MVSIKKRVEYLVGHWRLSPTVRVIRATPGAQCPCCGRALHRGQHNHSVVKHIIFNAPKSVQNFWLVHCNIAREPFLAHGSAKLEDVGEKQLRLF